MTADPAVASFDPAFGGPDIDSLPGGGGLQVLASLSASLGRVASVLEAQASKNQRMAQAVRQLTIGPGAVTLTAGAGTLLQDPNFGPNAGYAWSVRRLTAWGFSAGTVAVYLNSALGEPLPFFTSAGTLTFGRGDILLQPQDNLVFVATGITGSVSVTGTADNIELWALPDYLI